MQGNNLQHEVEFHKLLESAIGLNDRARISNFTTDKSAELILSERLLDIALLGERFGSRVEAKATLAWISILEEAHDPRIQARDVLVDTDPALGHLFDFVGTLNTDSLVREESIDHLIRFSPAAARDRLVDMAQFDPDLSLRISSLDSLSDLDFTVAKQVALAIGRSKDIDQRLEKIANRIIASSSMTTPSITEKQTFTEDDKKTAALLATCLDSQNPALQKKAILQFLSKEKGDLLVVGAACTMTPHVEVMPEIRSALQTHSNLLTILIRRVSLEY